MTNPVRVPFAPPFIGEEEIESVAETLRSGWLASGPKTAKFEERFRALVEVEGAVATSGCTGALHIAMVALGVGQGSDDEVILPALTFPSTGLAVVHAGGRPVIADVRRDTYTLDPEALAKAITKNTRAVMLMHYGGYPTDYAAVAEVADAAGIPILEDAAHGIGCRIGDKPAGSLGVAGAFSFYANKNITSIEGGMLVSDRADILERARRLRLHGISRDAYKRTAGSSWRYEVVEPGFKYPMNDVQAAVGLGQLDRLDGFQEHRAAVADAYHTELADIPGIRLPARAPAGSVHGNHLFAIEVDPAIVGMDREEFGVRLAELGIQTSVHFVPLHLHPYFQKEWGYSEGQFPVTEEIFERILSIPMFGTMTTEQAAIVVEAIRSLTES